MRTSTQTNDRFMQSSAAPTHAHRYKTFQMSLRLESCLPYVTAWIRVGRGRYPLQEMLRAMLM